MFGMTRKYRDTGQQQGFTFIELAVVLFILGIVFGAALLITGNGGSFQRVRSEATILYQGLTFLKRQAVLSGAPIGLNIENGRYQSLALDEDNMWHITDMFESLRHTIDPNVRITFTERRGTFSDTPRVTFFPGGDYTQFTAEIYTAQDTSTQSVTIRGDGFNSIIIE